MTACSVICCFWFRWAQCFAAAKFSHRIQSQDVAFMIKQIGYSAVSHRLLGFGNEQSNVNRKSPNDRHSTARISIHNTPAARKSIQYANNAKLQARTVQTLYTVFVKRLYIEPCQVRLSEKSIFGTPLKGSCMEEVLDHLLWGCALCAAVRQFMFNAFLPTAANWLEIRVLLNRDQLWNNCYLVRGGLTWGALHTLQSRNADL